jgi:hypothetical protein
MTLSRPLAAGLLQYDAHSAISRRHFSNRSPRRYDVALEGVMYFMLFNADGTLREKGDLEKCMRWAQLLKDYASSLAPYESPKLSSITLPQAPRTDQEVTVRVNIFNDRGERLAEIVDGEELKQIEEEEKKKH